MIGWAAGPLRSTPPYEWTVELSVTAAEGARGRGVRSGLYAALLCALEGQGYRNAFAVTTLPNPASERLHDRMGFEPVGTFPAVGYKLGEWHDVRWWYCRLAALAADPEPPPFPELRGTDELAAALHAGERRLGR